jgi:hypothetical protein
MDILVTALHAIHSLLLDSLYTHTHTQNTYVIIVYMHKLQDSPYTLPTHSMLSLTHTHSLLTQSLNHSITQSIKQKPTQSINDSLLIYTYTHILITHHSHILTLIAYTFFVGLYSALKIFEKLPSPSSSTMSKSVGFGRDGTPVAAVSSVSRACVSE